jgi:hypothetical protein
MFNGHLKAIEVPPTRDPKILRSAAKLVAEVAVNAASGKCLRAHFHCRRSVTAAHQAPLRTYFPNFPTTANPPLR